MQVIAIPLSPCGGFSGDDAELRYALRSLEQHFQDMFEIVIVGSRLPGWLQNVTHLPCGQGLKTALTTTAEAYPDGFFWFYDDCCVIRDTNTQEMMLTPRCGGFGVADGTKWGSQLEEIRKRLENEGISPVDFSRPHGPYWFNKSMIDEAFDDWPGMSGKFPFESWILSKRRWEGVRGMVKQYYGPFREPPDKDHRYLNYSDAGNTPALREWLQNKFPRPSRFEPRGASAFFLNIAGNGSETFLSHLGGRVTTMTQWKSLPWSSDALQKSWIATGRLPVITAVRDPIDRAVASYVEIASKRYPESEPHYRVLSALFRCVSFSSFWESADVESLMTVIPHLMPQTTFIRNAPLDSVIRFETAASDMRSVLSKFDDRPLAELREWQKPAEIDVSDAAKRRILSLYESDVSFFYPSHK